MFPPADSLPFSRLLPLRYREVLVLRDLQGLSYEEVAAVVGIPVGTVKAQVFRGRAQLRQVLRARGWAPA